jgi:phage I-like protein
MAEHDDSEKKMEEDEDKVKKMSESFNTSNVALLNEVQALKEQLNSVVKENNAIKCDKAVNQLLNEGKITPAERKFAVDAFNMKELQPTFWQMFSERPSNQAVPLQEVGHGASGQEISKATLSEKIKALATEKQITFSEALNIVRDQDPMSYRKAYGV